MHAEEELSTMPATTLAIAAEEDDMALADGATNLKNRVAAIIGRIVFVILEILACALLILLIIATIGVVLTVLWLLCACLFTPLANSSTLTPPESSSAWLVRDVLTNPPRIFWGFCGTLWSAVVVLSLYALKFKGWKLPKELAIVERDSKAKYSNRRADLERRNVHDMFSKTDFEQHPTELNDRQKIIKYQLTNDFEENVLIMIAVYFFVNAALVFGVPWIKPWNKNAGLQTWLIVNIVFIVIFLTIISLAKQSRRRQTAQGPVRD